MTKHAGTIKHNEKMTSITSCQSAGIETASAPGSTSFWKLQKCPFLVRYCYRPHCDSHVFLNIVCKYILEKCPLFVLWSFCSPPQGCGTLRCFSLVLPLTKHFWFLAETSRYLISIHVWLLVRWKTSLCVVWSALSFSLPLCLCMSVSPASLSELFCETWIFFSYLPGTGHPDDGTERLRGNTLQTFYCCGSCLISLQNSRNLSPSLSRSVFIFSHKSAASYLYVHGSYEGAHGVTSWFIWYANEGQILQISPDFFCWHASNLTSKTSQSSQMCIF